MAIAPELGEGIEQIGINYPKSLELQDSIEAEIALWRAIARSGIQKLAELNAAKAVDSTELCLIQRLSHYAALQASFLKTSQ